MIVREYNEKTMTSEERAFICAPLATPFAFVAFVSISGASGFDMGFNAISSFLFITVFGLPIVYTIEFFLGYRFYRLFLKLNKLNIFSITFGGMILANIPTLFIWMFSGFSGDKEIHVATIFALFSFVGFTIGITFWLLLNWDQMRKRS